MLSGLKKLLGGGSDKDKGKDQKSSDASQPTIGQTIGGPTISRPMRIAPKLGGGGDLSGTTKKTGGTNSGIPTIGRSSSVTPKFNLEEDKPKTEPSNNNLSPKTNNNNSIGSRTTGGNSSSVKPNLNSDNSNKLSALLKQTVEINASSGKEEEIATIFSEGQNQEAISTIKNYFKEKHGNVESRIWFMLMDLYQITGDTQEFDKTALGFAQAFGTSPPSWFGPKKGTEEKENIGTGKSMIIFDAIMKPDYPEKFKELLKSAKQDKFCRINISQCKFDQNIPDLLEKFLKLLTDLRKAKVVAVLMGDNNLITFCNRFIKEPEYKKHINGAFLENELLVWLVYLEILQWKNQAEEFENIALEFADKFEVSPPGWEENGSMNISNSHKSDENMLMVSLDKDLNTNNINDLLNSIDSAFDKQDYAEIDLTGVNRIDFSAAGSISYHIQELWGNPKHTDKKVIFKYPNELIIVLLQMLGVTEVVNIIPRNRK